MDQDDVELDFFEATPRAAGTAIRWAWNTIHPSGRSGLRTFGACRSKRGVERSTTELTPEGAVQSSRMMSLEQLPDAL
jgi:hypothetical protein